jgi:hypothetical protein
MQFTRMLRWPSSFAALRVRPTTPCLEATYAALFLRPMRPAMLAALTLQFPHVSHDL